MKKRLTLAFTLILSICLVCVIAVNANATPLTVSASDENVIAGQDVVVDIDVSNNTGFGVIMVEVSFDKEKLQIVESPVLWNDLPADYINTQKAYTTPVNDANAKGVMVFGYVPEIKEPGVHTTPITYNGTLTSIKFKAASTLSVGDTTPVSINISSCILEDENETEVETTTKTGTITVVACEHKGNQNTLVETVAPTCSSEGVKSANCSVCGELIEEAIPIDADAHKFGEWQVIDQPDCKNTGTKQRVCEHNAAHTEEGIVPVDPTAHNYGDWSTTKESTCTTPGKETRLCLNDPSHIDEQDLPLDPDAHVWGPFEVEVYPTCKDTGKQVRVCSENHQHTEEEDIPVDPNAHVWSEWDVVEEATCSTPGQKQRYCTKECGVLPETEEIDINPDAHKYDDVCDEDCNLCSDVRVAPHDYGEWIVTKKATFTESGLNHQVCGKCNHESESEIIYPASNTCLSYTSTTYNGKVKAPVVKVINSEGDQITSEWYTVETPTSRKYPGPHTFIVKFNEDCPDYEGSTTLTLTIKPPKTTLKKLTAYQKSIKVYINKKTTQTHGYQIYWSRSKTFSSAKKALIKKNSTTTYTIKGLSRKKTYYVKVRTYKTASNGARVYSDWSTYKYTKTK